MNFSARLGNYFITSLRKENKLAIRFREPVTPARNECTLTVGTAALRERYDTGERGEIKKRDLWALFLLSMKHTTNKKNKEEATWTTVWMYVCMYVCIMYACMYVCMHEVAVFNNLQTNTSTTVESIHENTWPDLTYLYFQPERDRERNTQQTNNKRDSLNISQSPVSS